MPALPDSAADQLAADHGKNIARMAVKSFDSMLAAIAAGTNPRQAIADAQSAFTTRYAKSLARAFSDLLQRFVGVAEVRAMRVGDVPLSARLYAHNEVTAAQAAAIIREHAQGIHDARALAMRLYDGYDPQGSADRPLEGRARAELPAALRNLTADRDARASLQALVDKGLARAARLKTPALRAAYLEAFNAWAAGAGAEILRARLDVAVREKNRYMASRISRTELARAHQATVGAALMDDPLVSVVQVLLNPMHPHTDICDLHAKADLFGLGPGCYPKARAPLSPFHPHCLTGDAKITHSGRIISVSKRWFDGDVVVITTASGKSLTATVNHPVLTTRGWVRAGRLDVGDKVIARQIAIPVGRDALDIDQHQDMPTSIAEVVDAFLRSGEVAAREVPMAAEDFHGDGVTGQIAVIGADGELWDRVDARAAQVLQDSTLKVADVGEFALPGNGDIHLCLKGLGGSSHGVMGGLGHGGAPLGANPVEADDVLLGLRSQLDAGFNEPLGESWAADAELARKIQNGSTGPVFEDEVVNVELNTFSGHVYNLETETGHYTGNSIVNHNCWCKIRARYDLSAADAREVPHGVALHLRGMPPAVAARIMGSEARALEVMAGKPVHEVLNRGVDPAYQFRRLGDGVRQPFPPVPVPVPVPPPASVKPAPPPVPAPPPPPPATHLEFIAEGRRIMGTLPAIGADAQFGDVRTWHTAVFDRLRAENIIGKAAAFAPQRGAVPLGALRAQMDEASAMYPRTWVAAADAAGPLFVKGSSSRCWAWTADRDRPIGANFRGWSVDRYITKGEGFMTVGPGDLSVTIHEFGHRLQETVKGLDDVFQSLHRERVAGAPVRRIKDVGPAYRGYAADEVTREDHYRNAYQGREYTIRSGKAEDGGALEVLTMAFEAVVGGQAPGKTSATLASVARLRDMLMHDREMVELVVGLLFRFNPIA